MKFFTSNKLYLNILKRDENNIPIAPSLPYVLPPIPNEITFDCKLDEDCKSHTLILTKE